MPPTIHRASDSRRAMATRAASAQHADHVAPRSWSPPWEDRADASPCAPFVAAHIILSTQYPHPDILTN